MTIEEYQLLGQRHSGELRAFALMLTRDEEHALDLLQEVSYLVLKRRDSFTVGTNFVAWAKTIIRNTFISDYRRQKRRRELFARDQPASLWLGDRSVDNQAESQLGEEDILAFIDRLPAIYRRSFVLHFHGNKYREIAQLTGVPIGTAKSRVFMARAQLRKWLSASEGANS
ncbi:MAG: sigma-70 family RNA polymerase sigma factor [Bacteroidota bacterium]